MSVGVRVPTPLNDAVQQYEPGSAGRDRLADWLAKSPLGQALPMTIGGEKRLGGGTEVSVVEPYNRHSLLWFIREAAQEDTADAVQAALSSSAAWRDMDFVDRAAVFLKAADLLAGPWRERVVAATMLGQSKTATQAELDASCELIDFFRFNVKFAEQICDAQPSCRSAAHTCSMAGFGIAGTVAWDLSD